MKLKVAIFDMDGTLVDSALDFDKMREEIGISEGKPILEFIETLSSEDEKKRALAIVHKHELKGVENAILYPGVSELMELLKRQGIYSAIFTRNSKEVTEKTLQKFDLKMNISLSRDDVEKPKPHPEGLFKICGALGVSPDESIFVGDYLFDLVCGKNAGIKSLLYDRRKNSDFYEHAHYIFDDYHFLVENFESILNENLKMTL